GKPLDTLIKLLPPLRRQTAPVCGCRCTLIRQHLQGLADRSQRNAHALRNFNEGDPSQHIALITSLITGVAPASNQTFKLVKIDGRNRTTTPFCNLANTHFRAKLIIAYLFHVFPLFTSASLTFLACPPLQHNRGDQPC